MIGRYVEPEIDGMIPMRNGGRRSPRWRGQQLGLVGEDGLQAVAQDQRHHRVVVAIAIDPGGQLEWSHLKCRDTFRETGQSQQPRHSLSKSERLERDSRLTGQSS